MHFAWQWERAQIGGAAIRRAISKVVGPVCHPSAVSIDLEAIQEVAAARRVAVANLLRSASDRAGISGSSDGAREPLEIAGVALTVVVVDTQEIARACVRLARGGTPLLFAVLGSGRATVLVAEHIPTEVPRAITRICRKMAPATKQRALVVWRDVVAPKIRVVPLPLGELLRPEIQIIARHDLDDLPLAALAAFLAPSVILSGDSIFLAAGLAAGCDDARGALNTMTSSESIMWSAMLGAGATGQGIASGVRALNRAIRAHPEVAFVVVVSLMAFAVLVLSDPARTRRAVQVAKKATHLAGGTAVEITLAAAELKVAHDDALANLGTYCPPPWRSRTVEELAAVRLAQFGEPVSGTGLLRELQRNPHPDVVLPATITELNRLLDAHPAFRRAGRGWALGYPAEATARRALEGVLTDR